MGIALRLSAARHEGFPRLGPTGHRRGFTLVELVIVGALIALFSGLAIFSVQQQYRNNQRKAIVAETRQVATALDMANLDTGIFPKLCWLEQSDTGLRFIGRQLFGTGPAGLQIYDNMELLQRDTSGKAFALSQNWRGPYFAVSQTRAGAGQGQGGLVNMILPEYASNPRGAEGFRWPADVWGNPYVVYMLNVNRTTGVLSFINEDPLLGFNPESKGDFINAVVSYGPNGVPGGGDLYRVDDFTADTGPAGKRLFRILSASERGRPIYREFADFTGAKGADMANAWAKSYNDAAGLTGTLALDNDGANEVGITDSGSDDIVFEF